MLRTDRQNRLRAWIGVAAVGGALIGIGILAIFALYGLVPLMLGIVLVVSSVRKSKQTLMCLIAVGLALMVTVSFVLWGSEHIWANPSCSQRPNQSSGQITYWS